MLKCEKHGLWINYSINNLVNCNTGCAKCSEISDEYYINSFFAAYPYNPDTSFVKSERRTKQGHRAYWKVCCGDCGDTYEAATVWVRKGVRGCRCNANRPLYSYISGVYDDKLLVALKFGITKDLEGRVSSQGRATVYDLKLLAAWLFKDSLSCRNAELECKHKLFTPVVSKTDMPDGWTETTYTYNFDNIAKIYEEHGGVKVEVYTFDK